MNKKVGDMERYFFHNEDGSITEHIYTYRGHINDFFGKDAKVLVYVVGGGSDETLKQ